ncbi:MAG: hypothetical protein H7Y36_10180 [Armatimonadetes bacterium]|nr:hypothetical protein [Akkermansiaceae bacterium]
MLKKISIVLFGTGWLLFLALAWFSRVQILNKLGIHRNSTDNARTVDERVQQTTQELAKNPWLDQRLPVIFLGDSHMEMGNWYVTYRGRFAVRNLGISMSRISDSGYIAKSIKADHASAVVLMCGINDLAAGRTREECLEDYQSLFETLKKNVPTTPVVILSLMPVSRGLGDSSKAEINRTVSRLNSDLKTESLKYGFTFIDLNPQVQIGIELNPALTFDGLHLNSRGYAAIATPIFQALVTTKKQ